MTLNYKYFILKQILKKNNFKYFIIFLLLKLTFSFLTSIIATYFDPTSTQNPIDKYDITANIILSLIIAPLLETLLFQYALIELLLKTKLSPLFIIAISSLLFGLSHNYNISYIIATTISGFFYATYYYKLRNQGRLTGFLLITLLHSLSNLASLFL